MMSQSQKVKIALDTAQGKRYEVDLCSGIYFIFNRGLYGASWTVREFVI